MELKLQSFNMIEKTDVPGGYQCVLDFGNDTQLSIISGVGASGNETQPYEIGVIKEGVLSPAVGITTESETTKGYLTEEEVDLIIFKMTMLTGKQPTQV